MMRGPLAFRIINHKNNPPSSGGGPVPEKRAGMGTSVTMLGKEDRITEHFFLPCSLSALSRYLSLSWPRCSGTVNTTAARSRPYRTQIYTFLLHARSYIQQFRHAVTFVGEFDSRHNL